MSAGGLLRGLGFFLALSLLPVFGVESWVMNMAVFILMFAVMSSAWNLVGGFAGYPSLGHAAFFGFGAYALGIWFKHHELSNGYEPFLLLPLVGGAAALIALPIGLVAMRTRTDVFAIVTITLLFVGQTIVLNQPGLTGGSSGLAFPIPPFEADTFEWPFYYVLVLLLAVSMGITWWTMRSKLGMSLEAVRADEDKARGMGVPTLFVKLLAFCVSAALVAMVGAVWGYYLSFVYPVFAFDPLVTVAMVLMTFLGGRATLWGPVVGAVILETTKQVMAYQLGDSQVYLVAYAAAFLAVILLLPRGVVPTVRERLRARERSRRSDDAQDESATEPATEEVRT